MKIKLNNQVTRHFIRNSFFILLVWWWLLFFVVWIINIIVIITCKGNSWVVCYWMYGIQEMIEWFSIAAVVALCISWILLIPSSIITFYNRWSEILKKWTFVNKRLIREMFLLIVCLSVPVALLAKVFPRLVNEILCLTNTWIVCYWLMSSLDLISWFIFGWIVLVIVITIIAIIAYFYYKFKKEPSNLTIKR